jgi:hypothetical protein
MSKTKTLTDLNNHVFDVIERLIEGNDPEADPKDCISVERANAVCDAAQVIVNSAKVQADVMKAMFKDNGSVANEALATFFGDNSKKLLGS